MGQLLHGSARTTAAVRRAKMPDAPLGPKPASSVLSAEQEAICVALRTYTQLPLDDCLYALQTTIPKLTRSALHGLSPHQFLCKQYQKHPPIFTQKPNHLTLELYNYSLSRK